MGISIITWQGMECINHNKIIKQNNLVTANVYSEVYNKNNSSESHKIIATYFVDSNDYTYVRKYFKKGNIETSVEIYYDSKNPSNAVEKKSTFDISLITISLLLIVLSVPYLLPFKKK